MSGERPQLFGRELRRIHAVGVGGMGLGPLAVYLQARGFEVSGEDDALADPMLRTLDQAGIALGDVEASRASAELVVVSSAIKPDHPARQAAEAAGIPVRRRGEVLAEIARDRRLVAVAGSHGKTSVTAMLVAALRRAGHPIDYVLGGLWGAEGWEPAEALADNGGWLVAEVDESDGTIDGFAPAITTVVNLDWDHPDRYGSEAALRESFNGLLARTTQTVLLPVDSGLNASEEAQTFGKTGDFQLLGSETTAQGLSLKLSGAFALTDVSVAAWGEFNAVNAAAALATAQLMGFELSADALVDYPGVHRRQSLRYQDAELTVLEDYAHHPEEIAALLAGVRERMAGQRRMLVVFQPHRHSRTRQFLADFVRVLPAADQLFLLDVYAAGEAPLEGGHTSDLAAALADAVPDLPLHFSVGQRAQLTAQLDAARQPGDWVVFVGAGDLEQELHQWLEQLREAGVGDNPWDALASELVDALTSSTKIRREEPMANKTTIRIGGPARLYVEPENLADLQTILRTVSARGLPLYLLGRGSNVLVPDTGIDGVVVSLRRAGWEEFAVQDDGSVRVGAGLRLKNLCGLAAKAGLAGFEFLEGIPGNVGGALRMNAGAMGGWMFDVVDSVDALTLDGERHTWSRDELTVGYRHCRELESAIAVGAVLRPRELSESDQVGRQIDVYRCKRQESQPREPSAGCIFKNPDGDSAGRLIDAGGLKGWHEGGAEVSPVHGNFIVNRGGASCDDVVRLVRRVRAAVHDQTGITLNPEVLLLGAKWEDLL